MIFAELDYPEHYDECHEALALFLETRFKHVESGHQGDSWIWIFSGNDKVEVDTFTSMKHQVKSAKAGTQLLAEVLSALGDRYTLKVYESPEIEPHDDIE